MTGETTTASSRILILGAGVSGLRVAKAVSRNINADNWEIVLIDENSYHQYLYRIHEVCNKDYRDEDIIVPLTKVIDEKRVRFKQKTVASIDWKRKNVITDSGEEPYDILVIALGSHPAYYSIEGMKENSLVLDSYKAAKILREKIENLFIKAKDKRFTPTILIGGAGFTGIELAGELTDFLPFLYGKNGLRTPEKLLTVVEALSTILPGWDEELALKGQRSLEGRGVEFILSDPIIRVGQRRVELKSGRILEPDLFIWNGGVTGDPACEIGFEIRSRRIVIDSYCGAAGFDDIFVAGDMACTSDENDRPQPPTAHIAMVQGDIVAHNVLARVMGSEMRRYVFNRAGEIITLGRADAVGDLFGIKFSGALAKFLKRCVHWWYVYSIGGLRLLLGS